MGWIISFVAFCLLMAVLAAAGFRLKNTRLTPPARGIGDRVITVFMVCTFAIASIYGLTLLAAKIWL